MEKASHYEYGDGSANLYIITPDSLEYIPVKPEESSTGMYSGGEPKSVRLAAGQFESIRKLLEKAINNSDIQIQDRMKMSGVISVVNGKEEKAKYIITPGCDEQKAIEALLKEIIK